MEKIIQQTFTSMLSLRGLKRFMKSTAESILMEVTTDGSTQLSYNAVILMRSMLRQATLVLLIQAGEEMSKDHFKLATSHCSFQKIQFHIIYIPNAMSHRKYMRFFYLIVWWESSTEALDCPAVNPSLIKHKKAQYKKVTCGRPIVYILPSVCSKLLKQFTYTEL